MLSIPLIHTVFAYNCHLKQTYAMNNQVNNAVRWRQRTIGQPVWWSTFHNICISNDPYEMGKQKYIDLLHM